MLTKEDNELLTQVGPGTAMGELFRRFWLPALLSEELTGPDGEPVRLKILGEELIAFKDSDGRIGILDAYCPHRSAPMFFGRNEEAGLRCVYHGWKFDVNGRCLDMPNCVEGESFKLRMATVAYPNVDRAGMIWVYMGPPERMPPLPEFPWMDLPAPNVYVKKYLLDCNYAQTLENEFDGSHAAWLHSTLDGRNMSWALWSKSWGEGAQERVEQERGRVGPPRIADYSTRGLGDIVDTRFGSALVRSISPADAETQTYFMGVPFWMPWSSSGGLSAPGVSQLNIKVPVDDEHSAFFRFKWSEQPLSDKVLAEMEHGGYEFPAFEPGTFRPLQNKSNDYMIDRVKQRFFNFTGIVNTPVQDFAMTENQRGPITDRTRERLVSSDKYVIHVRRRLMDSARALQQGVEPSEPWNADAYRLRLPRRIEVASTTPLDEVVEHLLLARTDAQRAAVPSPPMSHPTVPTTFQG